MSLSLTQPEHCKQQWKLPRTQAQADGYGACTVCAVMFADAVLHRQIVLSPPVLDRMLTAGCAAWRLLATVERRAAAGIPSEYLTVQEVVKGLVNVATGEPRWRITKELYGLHTSGTVPKAVVEQLRHLKTIDSSGATVPMEYCDDLCTALRQIDSTLDADDDAETVAAAVLTWSSSEHSVCVGARAHGSDGHYYVVDSQSGLFTEFDAPRHFVAYVVWNVCRPRQWTAADAERFTGTELPGQFCVSMLALK